MTTQEKHQPLSPVSLRLIQTIVKWLGYINPGLAAYYAYHVWHTTRRFKQPERELQWQQAARTVQLTAAGKNLVVYEWEQGPTVLLIHGWSGRGMQLGAMAQGLGQAGYQAIAIDLPAHGKSQGKKTNAYVMADAIAVVAAHYGDVHGVVSHSFGILPLVLALRDGLIAQRIVAICPPDRLSPLFDIFCDSLGLSANIKQKLAELTEKNYGDSVWDDVSPAFNVQSIQQAALIIHDENDKELSWRRGKALADSWPDSAFKLTQGLGHRRILRDSSVIEQIVNYLHQDDH